jgi:hypothetical protein
MNNNAQEIVNISKEIETCLSEINRINTETEKLNNTDDISFYAENKNVATLKKDNKHAPAVIEALRSGLVADSVVFENRIDDLIKDIKQLV